MYEDMNAYGWIFQKAWEMMSIEFTINGFTTSWAQVYCFSLICILMLRAICFYLFTVR